jgi:uncharacterized RDD family membrane protein YckC
MTVAHPYTYAHVLTCLVTYHATLTWLVGWTAGKVVLGLAVVRPDGEQIRLVQAARGRSSPSCSARAPG